MSVKLNEQLRIFYIILFFILQFVHFGYFLIIILIKDMIKNILLLLLRINCWIDHFNNILC